ncbi:glycosyltransferase family 2 protein [Diaminobutyricibacter sp. McL0608]|uniref:glycosyltransferase family 2 protein n=1 Tax=Leifsonia sp. McL0608 TaxID=3143537 RepID=UPI0031F303D5
MTATVDVVVPVYGKWELTRSCLDHLRRQSAAHHVIVVDDAGPDDTVSRLREEYPEVTVVALERNLGFAGACNAGIRAGSAEIVILVNNDVDAEPELVERLTAAFDDEEIGSACPLLLKPDGRVDAFGICADPTMAGFVRYNGATVAEALAKGPATRLLGPYGAAAAYRRSALDDVGLLDEGIVMYGEELDLALRLSAAGWRSGLVAEARGTHLGGATSGRGSASQRRKAGFGRGYLLRAYGVLRGRYGIRALITEAIVCVGDLLLSRDIASTTGRLAGWRAGGSAFRRSRQIPGVDYSIGFAESLRLRVGDRRA